MDVFVEQIVKKRNTTKDIAVIVGIILAALILCFVFAIILPALVPILGTLSLFLVAGTIFGAYWLISSMNLEFEYAATNGDLTVDKIIHRRKRKRVINLDSKDIETMGKYKAADHAQKRYDKRINAARDENAEDCWYLTMRHNQFGNILLTFSPDERTLSALKPFIKRQLAEDKHADENGIGDRERAGFRGGEDAVTDTDNQQDREDQRPFAFP